MNWLQAGARSQSIHTLFVLTTQTAHWFQERGFKPGEIGLLPMARQALYNYKRNSKVFLARI